MGEPRKPVRPYLRKGGGVTGRAMHQMHYPELRTSPGRPRPEWVDLAPNTQQNFEPPHRLSPRHEGGGILSNGPEGAQTPPNGISRNVQQHSSTDSRPGAGVGRPVTADSGFPDEVGSVALSPAGSLRSRSASVVVDVSGRESMTPLHSVSSKVFQSSGAPSIIYDASEPSTSLPAQQPSSNEANPPLGNSTADFERLEAEIFATISTSEHSSDDADSVRHRQRIGEFAKNAAYSKDCSSGVRTPSVASESGGSCAAFRELISGGQPGVGGVFPKDRGTTKSKITLDKSDGRSMKAQGSLRRVAESQPHLSGFAMPAGKDSGRAPQGAPEGSPGVHTAVEPTGSLRRSESTPLLEKTFEEGPAGQVVRDIATQVQTRRRVPFPIRKEAGGAKKSEGAVSQEESTARQLRDLISYLDSASEEHRRRLREFEESVNVLRRENDHLRRERNELWLKAARFEKSCGEYRDELNALQEAANLQVSELESLRKQRDASSHLQRDDRDAYSADGLNPSVDQLRALNRQQEQKRLQQNTQIRSLQLAVKQKDKTIKDLRRECDALKGNLLSAFSDRAQMRGHLAREALEQQAVHRASNKAPVTTVTKKLNSLGSINRRLTETRPDFHLLFNGGSAEIETATATESGGGGPVASSSDRVSPMQPAGNKSVRWNEPVVSDTTPLSSGSAPMFNTFPIPYNPNAETINGDMQLVKMEESIFGRGSLYRSPNGDSTAHTETSCGHRCQFYEYSNSDTKWIHSSKRYEVAYYGHKGATVVRVNEDVAVIRHFISGQLEIYRRTGEFTLLTPNGTRTELVKDPNGVMRTEIYEPSGMVRVIGRNGEESVGRACETSCHRSDGSYVSVAADDGSCEWRALDYVVRRFRNGDAKVRLTLIDTTVAMLVRDVGTVKHSPQGTASSDQKYCVEWGTVMRERMRMAASGRPSTLNRNAVFQNTL